MTRTTVAAALLAVGAIGVLAWVVLGGPQPEPVDGAATASDRADAALSFDPFVVAPAVVATWPEDVAAIHITLDDDERSLLEAWQRANVVRALQARDLFEGEADEVLQAWTSAIHRADQEAMDRTVERVGWAAFAVFRDALTELLRKAQLTQTPLPVLLSDPTDITAQQAYEGCGDFIDFALEQGLIGLHGERLADDATLTLVFRYRWLQAFTGRLPIDQRMPGEELREFRRWRLEDAKVPLDARLRFIDAYGDSYGWTDAERRHARAIAYAEAGDLTRAEEVLAERD